MKIINYENNGRGRTCEAMLSESQHPLPYNILFLLPIPTTRDGKTLYRTDTDIESVIRKADTGTAFAGYGIPEWARAAICSRGGKVWDSAQDEAFLEENARLTAEGTVGMILTSSKKSLSDMTVGVVGYGRIGKKLVHLLLSLGCRVRVYTSKKNVQLDLCECAIDCLESRADADLSGLDILVNTAPCPIFPAERLSDGLRVIELASGNNFGSLPQARGYKSYSAQSCLSEEFGSCRTADSSPVIERYPSLPSVMYPYSAGAVWAKSVLCGLAGGGK